MLINCSWRVFTEVRQELTTAGKLMFAKRHFVYFAASCSILVYLFRHESFCHPLFQPRKYLNGYQFVNVTSASVTIHSETRQVISYSLYGSNPRYIQGALENAVLAKKLFPNWEMRIYHDRSVPQKYLNELEMRGVLLIDTTKLPYGKGNKMNWKLLVTADKKVDRFVFRDIDSRLSIRERVAVEEWIKSKKKFHIMRDHPSHSRHPISGGMWGAVKGALQNMEQKLNKHKNNAYIADMHWLNKVVWPIAQKSSMQHDAFSCKKYKGAISWPTKRVPWEHVGSVVRKGKLRKGDVQILKRTKQDPRCRDRNESQLIDKVKAKISYRLLKIPIFSGV